MVRHTVPTDFNVWVQQPDIRQASEWPASIDFVSRHFVPPVNIRSVADVVMNVVSEASSVA